MLWESPLCVKWVTILKLRLCAREHCLSKMYQISLLKPTDYATNLQFNTHCTLCPHCIYVFCIYLITNSDLFHSQHKLIGIYNRDEKCLQRGTDWCLK
jgi:hypothetical protein